MDVVGMAVLAGAYAVLAWGVAEAGFARQREAEARQRMGHLYARIADLSAEREQMLVDLAGAHAEGNRAEDRYTREVAGRVEDDRRYRALRGGVLAALARCGVAVPAEWVERPGDGPLLDALGQVAATCEQFRASLQDAMAAERQARAEVARAHAQAAAEALLRDLEPERERGEGDAEIQAVAWWGTVRVFGADRPVRLADWMLDRATRSARYYAARDPRRAGREDEA